MKYLVKWMHWNPFDRELEPHEQSFTDKQEALSFMSKIELNWSVTEVELSYGD